MPTATEQALNIDFSQETNPDYPQEIWNQLRDNYADQHYSQQINPVVPAPVLGTADEFIDALMSDRPLGESLFAGLNPFNPFHLQKAKDRINNLTRRDSWGLSEPHVDAIGHAGVASWASPELNLGTEIRDHIQGFVGGVPDDWQPWSNVPVLSSIPPLNVQAGFTWIPGVSPNTREEVIKDHFNTRWGGENRGISFPDLLEQAAPGGDLIIMGPYDDVNERSMASLEHIPSFTERMETGPQILSTGSSYNVPFPSSLIPAVEAHDSVGFLPTPYLGDTLAEAMDRMLENRAQYGLADISDAERRRGAETLFEEAERAPEVRQRLIERGPSSIREALESRNISFLPFQQASIAIPEGLPANKPFPESVTNLSQAVELLDDDSPFLGSEEQFVEMGDLFGGTTMGVADTTSDADTTKATKKKTKKKSDTSNAIIENSVVEANQEIANSATAAALQAQQHTQNMQNQAQVMQDIAANSGASDDAKAAARAQSNADTAAHNQRQAQIERAEADARNRATQRWQEEQAEKAKAKAKTVAKKAKAEQNRLAALSRQRAAEERVRKASQSKLAKAAEAERVRQQKSASAAALASARMESLRQVELMRKRREEKLLQDKLADQMARYQTTGRWVGGL